MRSRFSCNTLLVVVAVSGVLSGCAGKQLSLSKMWSRDQPDIETVSTQPAPRDVALDSEVERATKRQSPFLDRPDVIRTTEQADATTSNGGEILQTSAQSEVDAKKVSDLKARLDADTLMLIEEEFRDSTREERADWYEILLGVEPSVVPHLLAARRATAARRTTPRPSAYVPGPEPGEFVSVPPAGTASQPVVRPGIGETPAPHPLAPTVTPGERVTRSPVRQETDERRQPVAQQPVATTPQAQAPAHSADAVLRQAHADRPVARRETGAQPQSAPTWPPREGSDSKIRRSGFIEMPTESPVQQVAATESAGDGKYALANDWDTQLQTLIDLIEREVSDPATTAPGTEEDQARQAELQVFLRMLYLMDGQQTRSLQAIPEMPATHQEFWTQMFWGMTNYFDREGIADPSHRATETITQLRTAIERLKPESRLQLRNASFSHKIDSFGDYEQFDLDEFEAGQPVLVYVEVQNFTSDIDTEGRYKTRLRSTVEIHRAGRGPESGLVHTQNYPATEDTCRNFRQDYFHSYRIDLPATLTPGPHILKLMVEDELSQRIATASLSFVVK